MSRFNPYTAGSQFDLVSYHQKRETSEVKEDPEQQVAYERLVELLGAAGYFRVRLPGLSPFDKVLGGMAWAISASAVAVDVDVFFDDDANLGEKNARAEDVCRALLRMKCPMQLRSFQITRQDWKSVLPVVTWLIRTVLETREENEQLLRTFAECEFTRTSVNASTTVALTVEKEVQQSAERFTHLHANYGPKRRLRHKDALALNSRARETERTLNVLREYSESSASSGGSSFNENDYAAAVAAANVSGAVVGGILGLQSEQLRHFRSLYEQRAAFVDSKVLAQRMHLGRVEGLKKRIEDTQGDLTRVKGEHMQYLQQLQAFSGRVEAVRQDNAARRLEMEKFKESLASQQEIVAELQRLVGLNESLKSQMEAFERSCIRQTEELRQQVVTMRQSMDSDEVLQLEAGEKKRLVAIRQMVARKNRAVLLLRRKIDEVPTFAELSQYGRMLLELYEQINAKFVETRKYYNSFNSLDDSRRFLERELSILKSIADQYGEAMKSKPNKEQFVNSLQQIVGSVEQSHDKAKGKQKDETDRRDILHKEYVELLDKQRDYAKLTKEFSNQAALAGQYEARLQAQSQGVLE